MTCAAVTGDAELSLVAVIDPAYSSESALREEGDYTANAKRFTSLEDAVETAGLQVVVDFTTPSAVLGNALVCIRKRVPVVIGTTGLGDADLSVIETEAGRCEVPVLVAPNFAMGGVLMMKFAREAAEYLRACEICGVAPREQARQTIGHLATHKTARRGQMAGCEWDEEVPIHSVRLPGLLAHQEVIFGGTGEILTIRHDSLSRESFMPGVILAVKRVRGLQGLVVGLENIL
jgi:4-hydroxy-tetrahydrodipicolinate reductase